MHNFMGNLSIEKFLTRSEKKFFDKVRKDKLSNSASICSSQHGRVWGSPSVHDCFPSRELLASQYSTKSLSNPFPAPSGFASIRRDDLNAFNTQGLLINREPGADGVIMTRLQISLQREIAGWPLYTVILTLGQVWFPCQCCSHSHVFEDAGSDQHPDHVVVWSELAKQSPTKQSPAIRPRMCLFSRIYNLVHFVSPQAIHLRSCLSVDFLCIGILPHWITLGFERF